MRRYVLAVQLTTALLQSAVGQDSGHSHATGSHTGGHKNADGTCKSWSYTPGADDCGPSTWKDRYKLAACAAGDSCPGDHCKASDKLCGNCEGKQQSPVNLAYGSVTSKLGPLGLTPAITSCDRWHFANNGHSLQANPSSTCDTSKSHIVVPSIPGKKFWFQQIHIHSPSEHTVGSGFYDFEIHNVYSDLAVPPTYAVVAIFATANSQFNNSFLDAMWRLPLGEGFHKTKPLDVHSLLPADPSYFYYRGSFTTPPCTEGVHWFVMQSPVRTSVAELNYFRNTMRSSGIDPANNNRPTQPLNTRKVLYYSPGTAVGSAADAFLPSGQGLAENDGGKTGGTSIVFMLSFCLTAFGGLWVLYGKYDGNGTHKDVWNQLKEKGTELKDKRARASSDGADSPEALDSPAGRGMNSLGREHEVMEGDVA